MVGKIACLFSGHLWVQVVYEPAARVTAVRTCERCRRVESRIWDYSQTGYVWLKGELFYEPADIWIIAGTFSCYQDAAAEWKARDAYYKPHWLRDEMDIKRMEIIGGVWPVIRFAADWMEADVLQSDVVAKVLSFGHL